MGLLSSRKKRGIVTSAATSFSPGEGSAAAEGMALWHLTNNERGTGDYGGAGKGSGEFVWVVDFIQSFATTS